MSPTPPGSVAGRVRWRRWALPALLAAFAALAIVYSLATPIFEGPDEIWHFAFASYLADGGGLPVLSIEHPNLLLRNAAHPPLYFLPVAALIAPIDRADFPNSFRFNLASPNITPGSQSDRPNLLIHGRNEDFPYRQTVLAVHVGRLVSIALGVLTLVGAWIVARQLAPGAGEWVALATVAVVAFIPQFVYGSAMINNDALAAAGGTWTLAALLVLMQRRSWRWAALCGLALGGTLLSKIGMVALAPLPMVAVALANLDLLKKGEGRPPKNDGEWVSKDEIGRRATWALATLAIIYGGAAIVAGWWYVRNWVLYGDPLAWKLWVVLAGVGRPTPTVTQFASDMKGLFGTFWADFGLRVDRQWGWVFAILVVVALAGWGRRLVRRDIAQIDLAGLLLAAAAFVLLLASAVRYSLEITDIHGRLLYPAIAAVAFCLVMGLSGWGLQTGRGLVVGTIAGLFATTLLVPFLLIVPAYARPVLPSAELPAEAIPMSAAFGGAVELVGYRLLTPRVAPGQVAHLVTYWRTPVTAPLQIPDTRANMALIQPDGRQLGHVEVMLGSSVYPSSAWIQQDVIVADMVMQPPGDVNLPSVAAIWLSVRGLGPDALPTGSGTNVVLARVVLTGGAACTPATRSDADFGGLMRLLGYSLTGGRLTLCWSAERTMTTDYTVFVHLVDQTGALLGTADSPPRNGLYPTTAWLPREVVPDERQLTLPAGASIRLGVYRPDTGERLSLGQTGETEIMISP